MNVNRVLRGSFVLTAIVIAVGVLLVSGSGAWPRDPGVVLAQAPVCSWDNIGSSTSSLFHSAYAMDTDNEKVIVYGGFDDLYNVQNTVEEIDLSSQTLVANHRRIAVGTAFSAVGAAGAYRAKGADSPDSAAYFLGGVRNPVSGQATNEVQRFRVQDQVWERLTIGNAREFKDRFLAAAAYDPDHDLVWVVGGVGNCALPDTPANGGSCPARPLPTQYLSFDPGTGEPTWNSLPGGDRSIFGHTMIYDGARKRMLIYGGTTNLTRATNQLWALDLSDPDPSKATFEQIQTAVDGSGQSPAVYFHGAALDTSRDWLVVTGGVQQNYLTRIEVTESVTWALDLSAQPVPTWSRILQGTSASTRVGGVMTYSDRHRAVTFALGRDQTDGQSNTPEAMQRRTVGLVCDDAETRTPRPSTTVTTTPSATGPTPTDRATRTTRPTFTSQPSRTPFPTYTPSPSATIGPTATATLEAPTRVFVPYVTRIY